MVCVCVCVCVCVNGISSTITSCTVSSCLICSVCWFLLVEHPAPPQHPYTDLFSTWSGISGMFIWSKLISQTLPVGIQLTYSQFAPWLLQNPIEESICWPNMQALRIWDSFKLVKHNMLHATSRYWPNGMLDLASVSQKGISPVETTMGWVSIPGCCTLWTYILMSFGLHHTLLKTFHVQGPKLFWGQTDMLTGCLI